MLKWLVPCQKVVYSPKFEGVEQVSLFPFVSLHYEDCANIILSLDADFLPSSKPLTSSVLHQANAGSSKLGARGRMYTQHCISSATSACIVIFGEHHAEHICTNTKHSEPPAKGSMPLKGRKPYRDVGSNSASQRQYWNAELTLQSLWSRFAPYFFVPL